MNFYRERILPHLIRAVMRNRHLAPYRRRVTAAAWGRVLEIGIGSGENLPYYGANGNVAEIVGLEPIANLAQAAQAEAARLPFPVRIKTGLAEAIPLDDGSVDTVVMTWTLCSIANPPAVLSEIHRVLQCDGRLLFVEHGLAPDAGIRLLQRGLTPIWRHLAGGCHLNREMASLITSGGFQMERLETGYLPGPRPLTFMYEGSAEPA